MSIPFSTQPRTLDPCVLGLGPRSVLDGLLRAPWPALQAVQLLAFFKRQADVRGALLITVSFS